MTDETTKDRQSLGTTQADWSRLKLATLLDDTLADFRQYQQSRNWLAGHSLAESIKERIDQIGEVGGPRRLPNGSPTRIGHVLTMKEKIVQLVKEIKELPAKEENIPPSGNQVAHPDA